MPVEPPPSRWELPTRTQLADLPADDLVADDLVAVGADLEPGTLLAAYRRGLFPMPQRPGRGAIGWWCPGRRGVMRPGGMHVSRSLRRAARNFEIRVDTAFDEVVAGCADPRRPQGWIDDRIHAAYRGLHELGWVHSVEAWREGRLAGGLYGVAVGGLFCGESMFHRERDASKVALLGLVRLLQDECAERRLIDVQWQTPHLASLGVVEISRRDYLTGLSELFAVPMPAVFRA